jgi:hypothetical protein
MSRRSTRIVGLLVLGLIGAGLWWLLREEKAQPGRVAAVASEASASAGMGPRSRPALVVDPLKLARASIAGTIRDAQGQPIAAAQVCARTRAERLVSSETRKVECATSGRDGAYRIEGLLGVRHIVLASAPTFIPGPYFRGEGGEPIRVGRAACGAGAAGRRHHAAGRRGRGPRGGQGSERRRG